MMRRFCVVAVLLACPVAAALPQAGRDTLRIVFVGDMNLGRVTAIEYILTGRGAEIFAGVRDRLRAADIAVGNLESILLERGRYVDPPGIVFAGPAEAVQLLVDAGFDLVGTANNHAWDFGRAGLNESLQHLDRAGLPHTGTGATLADALRPVVLRRRGWTVAIFSLTTILNRDASRGAGFPYECCVAYADTTRMRRLIRAARDSAGADLVLVSVHAGSEYIPVPPPHVVAVFRALIRAGADAVIGHHPHVPQGAEHYEGKPVLYSLGNLIFRQSRPWTNRGLWYELTFFPDGRHAVQVLPIVVSSTPRFATGADSVVTMDHFAAISDSLRRLPATAPQRRVPSPRSRRRTP